MTDGEVLTTRYVAKSSIVSGTRDGTFNKPFQTIQQAIDYWGVPQTQQEYTLPKTINVIDTETYTENITYYTGNYTFNFLAASIQGNITWQIDNAERYGSTRQPQLNIIRNPESVETGLTGDIQCLLKLLFHLEL